MHDPENMFFKVISPSGAIIAYFLINQDAVNFVDMINTTCHPALAGKYKLKGINRRAYEHAGLSTSSSVRNPDMDIRFTHHVSK